MKNGLSLWVEQGDFHPRIPHSFKRVSRLAKGCVGVVDKMYLIISDWSLKHWHHLKDSDLVPDDIEVIPGLKLENTDPLYRYPLDKEGWQRAAKSLNAFVDKYKVSKVVIGSEPMWYAYWAGVYDLNISLLKERVKLLPNIEIHCYPGATTLSMGDPNTAGGLADRNLRYIDAWQAHPKIRFFVGSFWKSNGLHPRETDNREIAYRVAQILNNPPLEQVNWLWRYGWDYLEKLPRMIRLCGEREGYLYLDFTEYALERLQGIMRGSDDE